MLSVRAKPRIETVDVEELHYGKLVVAEDGPVHPGVGYAVTYRTRGLTSPEHLLPTRLLDGKALEIEHLDPAAAQVGALLIRRVDPPQRADAPRPCIALMRARFRPEAGEGQGGRSYLQARVLQIAMDDWDGWAPSILAWCRKDFRALPDRADRDASLRFNVPPTSIAIEVFKPPLSKAVEHMPPARQDRIARLIESLLAGHDASCVFGRDSFPGTEPAEAEFIDDLAHALVCLNDAGLSIKTLPPISVGLKAAAIRSGIRVLPSAPGDVGGTTWGKVKEQLAHRADIHARSQSFRTVGRVERPEAFSRNRAIGEAGARAAGADAAGLRSDPLASRTSLTGVTKLEPQPARPRTDALPTDFQTAFERCRRLADASPQGVESPEALRRACADLLRSVEDRTLRERFSHWNPFGNGSHAVEVAADKQALALLLGIMGREDLLDNFALAELCLVCKVADAASGIQLEGDRPTENWTAKLDRHIAQRVRKCGILWEGECAQLRSGVGLRSGDEKACGVLIDSDCFWSYIKHEKSTKVPLSIAAARSQLGRRLGASSVERRSLAYHEQCPWQLLQMMTRAQIAAWSVQERVGWQRVQDALGPTRPQ